MTTVAVSRWLADYLSGEDTMLLAATSAQAAELARRARGELVALSLVATSALIKLGDGNVAGPGDLITARQNARIQAGEPGRRLANRDLLRIEAWAGGNGERAALVRRHTGPDPVTGQVSGSARFVLPFAYMREHVELGYAGNVHVAQSRTVDTGHLVVDGTAGRQTFYVGMGRGRKRNTAYVITEQVRAADLSPQPHPAPELQEPGRNRGRAAAPVRRPAAVLERDQGDMTATEAIRRELDQAACLATLPPMWADLTRAHAVRRYESTIRSLLPAADWLAYQGDSERGTLARLLRAAELADHDTGDLLGRAIGRRDFAGARSIAAVLHGRIRQIVGTPEPVNAGSYLERTPVTGDPVAARFAAELAEAMNARTALLGQRAALDRPPWALRWLGDVPADPVQRDEWTRRAGIAAAWREASGWSSETDSIGPAPERGPPELRASWHAACTALRMPELDRQIRSATDRDLLAQRAAYAREAAWAPPYVTPELREAYLAEARYQADAVLARHRAGTARGWAERSLAWQQARELSALAEQVRSRWQALEEVGEARQAWHDATDQARQQALAADTELRRRHPGIDLPPMQAQHEQGADGTGPAAWPEMDDAVAPAAALDAARQARQILAERERQACEDGLEKDDLMRRREAEAMREARPSAVRQQPVPSRRAHWRAEPADLEPEAGG